MQGKYLAPMRSKVFAGGPSSGLTDGGANPVRKDQQMIINTLSFSLWPSNNIVHLPPKANSTMNTMT